LRFQRLDLFLTQALSFAGDVRIVGDDQTQIPPPQLADDLGRSGGTLPIMRGPQSYIGC